MVGLLAAVFVQHSFAGDVTVGITAPGTPSYPKAGIRRVAVTVLDPDDALNLSTSISDPLRGYAYLGTYTIPGRVVKVSLGSGGSVPAVVGRVSLLDPGAGYLSLAAIDPQNGNAYFWGKEALINNDIIPRMFKFALGAGSALPYSTGVAPYPDIHTYDEFITCVAIDAQAGYGYTGSGNNFSIVRIPSIIRKIALGDSGRGPALVSEVNLPSTVIFPTSITIDATRGYAYVGSGLPQYGYVPLVTKLTLISGDTAPTLVASAQLDGHESSPTEPLIDSVAGFAYFFAGSNPVHFVKVALGDGDLPPRRVGALVLNAGDDEPLSAAIDTAAGLAFATVRSSGSPAEAMRLSLGGGESPPTRVGSALFDTDDPPTVGGFDLDTGYGYFATKDSAGTRGSFVKFSLSQKGAIKATRVSISEDSYVTHARFYSHAPKGNVRLAIFDDAPAKQLLWQSGSVSNFAENAFVDVPISAGTPGQLMLPSGTYWLAWQIDTNADVPSYTAGADGDGFYLAQPYGEFPANIDSAAATPTDETWTVYLTTSTSPPQTPTPEPTPLAPNASMALDYTADGGNPQNWIGGALPGFGGFAAYTSSGLCMIVPGPGDNDVLWVSPERFLELQDGVIYRVRLTLSSSQSAPDAIPLFFVSYDNFNSAGGGNSYGGYYWVLDVDGGAEGIGRPQGRTTYDFYIAPNAINTPQWKAQAFSAAADAENDMRLIYRVIDANPSILSDDDSGRICVAGATITALLRSSLAVDQPVDDAPISAETHFAEALGEVGIGGTAIFDESHHSVRYQLLTGGEYRKTLGPYDPLAGADLNSQLFPVTWDAERLFRVRVGIRAESSESDPVNMIFVGMDSATEELGMNIYTTRAALGGPLNGAASPKLLTAEYEGYFFSQNATLSMTPNAGRLRPLAIFVNSAALFRPNLGRDAFSVDSLAVDRMVTPP